MCLPKSCQPHTPEQRQTQLVTFKHCSWCGRLPPQELGGLHSRVQKTESLAWGHYSNLYLESGCSPWRNNLQGAEQPLEGSCSMGGVGVGWLGTHSVLLKNDTHLFLWSLSMWSHVASTSSKPSAIPPSICPSLLPFISAVSQT